MEVALARVPLENLRRLVLRAVVGGDDEVDARVQVKGDLCVDHVRLVASEHGQNQLHAGSRLWSTRLATPFTLQRRPVVRLRSSAASLGSRTSSRRWIRI